MNPPQNVNNHFNAPLKQQEDPVNPLCCCYYNFTEQSFYKFINIWDLVFVVLACLQSTLYQLIFNVIFLIIVIIALVTYCNSNSYKTKIHVTYSIFRLVFVFLELILILVFGILCVIGLVSMHTSDPNFNSAVVFVVVNLGILLPINIVSIQWSFLLKRCVTSSPGVMNLAPGQFPTPDSTTQFTPQNSGYVN